MIGVGCFIEIFQVALTVGATGGCSGINTIDMTIRALSLHMLTRQRESGEFMIDNTGIPGGRRMADLALGTEALRCMVRIGRLIIIVLMTARAGCCGIGMQENRLLKIDGVVTHLAGLGWIAMFDVIRIRGAIEFDCMTGLAGGRGVDMLKNTRLESDRVMTGGAFVQRITVLNMVGICGGIIILHMTLGRKTVVRRSSPLIINVATCAIIRH
ncbi:MAG: hypothetical protein CO167_05650 [Candidatus Marinimicrobia bacterium CG_4_9_14_3_um_filter_48_9]|nr:MAG: hypothetical protein CO167_05650 [Candidatus Marinimicrobia bacterium CG_4_9_14_3_um_filter_48_9]